MNIKKQKVLVAAQRLFTEKGYSYTSVQDIIEAAKISKGTFYNYFSSKNECIIAILENASEETTLKRKEIYSLQNESNLNILMEQMSIRMNVYREHNLFPLMISIIHSQDTELRDLVKKNYMNEIKWLSKRFVDVFGKHTKEASTDCAVLALGMMQQLQHPWINQLTEMSFPQLIQFVMRRIETIINEMARTKDTILNNSYFELEEEEIIITRDFICNQLEIFYVKEKDNFQQEQMEVIEFILEELSNENPRKFILKPIVFALTEAFSGTPYEKESHTIISNISKLLEM